ncbi:DeoR/GlpR family DNA-binding transcription regulator [Chitinophaga nivalis]|uniref:DeoR/GlpR family DNA-binding transcription regulator n=1 Tax=Chitinophaga nivalis TaxID=2991709 RepID=A0ABT3IQB3_9BACT|nr:DeoR/GlpR family DNA-binding transcription regulator [Chitinophaga nivalis]MCW3464158.1 DeoR/GlpR family DNA-binding transcription regulator [Chitinophaga nivalis]MCW3486152.1 DeoR/GlpR family DNA-binding transcription regulator [Chitinophaga nivalis]
MNYQIRIQKILAQLEATGEVTIKGLAQTLGTAEITIRRDLNQLAADGMLSRTHGGAIKVNQPELPHRFQNKAAVNQVAKDHICRRAAADIQDGDIIFLDCGSTVFRLCPFIRNKKIKVITNSIPVIYALQDSHVSLNIIGGEFDATRQAIHGKMATQHIASYHATKAFVGVDGITPKGLFANSEKEATITLAMAAQSRHTYLLCDDSKIGKATYYQFADLRLVHTLITNATSDILKPFKKSGIQLISTP